MRERQLHERHLLRHGPERLQRKLRHADGGQRRTAAYAAQSARSDSRLAPTARAGETMHSHALLPARLRVGHLWTLVH